MATLRDSRKKDKRSRFSDIYIGFISHRRIRTSADYRYILDAFTDIWSATLPKIKQIGWNVGISFLIKMQEGRNDLGFSVPLLGF